MMRGLAWAIAALSLAGCGQRVGDKRAAALADEATIAPGIYGDVRLNAQSNELLGVELRLDRGSDSATLEFVDCQGWCRAIVRRPVRRGLGGVAFTVERDGRVVDATLQPAGSGAVSLTADWGNGVEQRRLLLLDAPMGLDIATLAVNPAVNPAAAPAVTPPP